MNTNNLILSLRKQVLIKTGLQNIDPGKCKNISGLIFQDTKNYISETTIKRFFGFANVRHNFSLFTLNSLSQYIGYQSWESFSKDRSNLEEKDKNIWTDIKFKSRALTQYALNIQKNNSGIPFCFTSARNFYYPDFDYFLNNSHYQFTTVSAQPGGGKSILISHLIDYFFLSENATERNSIVLLINSTTIRNIRQYGISLFDWIHQ